MLGSTFIRAIAAVALLFPVSVLASEADEPYFMGWYLAPESTEAINCRTDEVHTTLSADRNYGACCNTKDSDCRVATACFGTTVLYNDNSTMECSNGNYCMSFSILQSFPSGPSAVHLWCNSYWRAHTVYKELPEPTAAATVTKTKTVHSTVTAAAASCVTDNVAAETGSSDTVESEASNSNDEKEGAGASSKAWVAGAVIGPVAAIGLIGLAFWYGRRRAINGPDTPPTNYGAGGQSAAAVPSGPPPRGDTPGAMSAYHQAAPSMASAAAPAPAPVGASVPSYYFHQAGAGANQYYPGPPVQNTTDPSSGMYQQHQYPQQHNQQQPPYWAGKDAYSSDGSTPPPRPPTAASSGDGMGPPPMSAYPTPGPQSAGGYYAPSSTAGTIPIQRQWTGQSGAPF